jgi:hypothetical protein
MMRSPSWKYSIATVSENFLGILWKGRFCSHFKGNIQLVTILSWMNPIHALPLYLFTMLFHLILTLRLGLPRNPFSLHFTKNIVTLFPASHIYHVSSQSQDPWLYHPTNIWVISTNHLKVGLHTITLQGVNFFRKRQKCYFLWIILKIKH